tara:strand:+ start:534 stop:944 length:411 start_codon:yes stop_codon:yes gene_type:complete
MRLWEQAETPHLRGLVNQMEREMKNRYDELVLKTQNKVDLFINSLASGTNEQEAYNEAFKTIFYTWKIVSTIQIKDFSDSIEIGDTLYEKSEEDWNKHKTPNEAHDYAQAVANGLDGSKAYNIAVASAEINVEPVR